MSDQQALQNLSRARRGFLLALASLVLLSGCAFSRLQNEVAALAHHGVISGHVKSSLPAERLKVLAFATAGGEFKPMQQQILSAAGSFSFVVPHATSAGYALVAYDDQNGNGRFDGGEAAGHLQLQADAFEGSKLVEDLSIVVDARRTDLLLSLNLPPNQEDSGHSSATRPLGAVVDLGDPIYSADQSQRGLWEPLRFIQEVRGGIFFLEPYAASKTPVLFIHGAGGSPQDWRPLVDSLDRQRFQPWFFYYPSAIRLDAAAFWLDKGVEALHARHGFQRLVVAAHSMGGLVASRFITLNKGERQRDYVKLLVSLSTPWSGVVAAQWGIDFAPVAVPSWLDLAPDSQFLARMHAAPLPLGLDYYLLYSGHRANADGAGFDGVVSVQSQLDVWARRQARGVFGFDDSHMAVLKSPQAMARFLAILEQWAVN